MKTLFSRMLMIPIWVLEGIAVGLCGILPGVSGGTLCAAFGMYRPMVECVEMPTKGIRKHGLMLVWFLCGGVVGFFGLAGISASLAELYPKETVCGFLGLLLGTSPSLWTDAGKEGRSKKGYLSLGFGFLCMLGILLSVGQSGAVRMAPSAGGYVLCGVLWGLSFLVPGLSASSLIMFLGLYAPMLKGIGMGDLSVLLPLGGGGITCVFLLGNLIAKGFRKRYEVLSHGVLGTVMATAVSFLPDVRIFTIPWGLLGFAVSYLLTVWGNKRTGKT